MFSAIMKGKSETREDVITSSVFDTLLLLPDDLFWQLLRNSCYNGNKLPACAGKILEYEFWPHWNNKNTENEKYVEPDFYVSFENFDIIVEAKRGSNLQEKGQWEKEIISYINEHGEDTEVFLIAVDGIINEENEIMKIGSKRKINVFKSRWSKVLDACVNISKKYSPNYFINTNNYKRLIDMVVEYLIFYGFLKYSWLDELIQKRLGIKNYNNSIEQLKRIGCSIKRENGNTWLEDIQRKGIVINCTHSINSIKKIGGIS